MSKKESILILGGLLRRIDNFFPDIFEKSFDSRLIFQKTIYLLQAFGLYLGYRFSWYIRGPYSPALARKGYELVKKIAESPDVRFVKDSAENRFRDFFDFLGEKKYDADWMETLASIHFLKHTYPKRTQKEIMKKVLRKQPYLTVDQCVEAWEYLEKHGLLD